MRDVDEFTITQAVVERLGETPDPRLKAVLTSLVTHLHDFVRDVELTFEEWQTAIGFLTKTGQICDEHRQEFILLSDVLGVSMLVDAVNHRMPEGATETTVLGPFFIEDAPEAAHGDDISGALDGTPLLVTGSVRTAGGSPLAGAVVDVWHSDDDGAYDVQQLAKLGGFAGRARLRADAQGRFRFWSIAPQWYPIPADGPVGKLLAATARHPNRPAHVHFMIAAPGHETLVTHVFDADSPWLESDAVFGVKSSLVARLTDHGPGTAPDGREMTKPYRHLSYDFGLKPARAAAAAAE